VGKTSIMLRYVRDAFDEKQVSTLSAQCFDKTVPLGGGAVRSGARAGPSCDDRCGEDDGLPVAGLLDCHILLTMLLVRGAALARRAMYAVRLRCRCGG
jgi:hypothetical protein